jgi:hypothetical protein
MKDEFRTPNAQWPDGRKVIEAVLNTAQASPPPKAPQPQVVVIPPAVAKALITIATNAWRSKVKMLDKHSGEVREDMKRVDRHVEAILRSLQEIGFEIKDHTGDAYDDGQPMRVIACQSTPSLSKKCVLETLLPTVFFNGQIVQNGEIVLATPEITTQ